MDSICSDFKVESKREVMRSRILDWRAGVKRNVDTEKKDISVIILDSDDGEDIEEPKEVIPEIVKLDKLKNEQNQRRGQIIAKIPPPNPKKRIVTKYMPTQGHGHLKNELYSELMLIRSLAATENAHVPTASKSKRAEEKRWPVLGLEWPVTSFEEDELINLVSIIELNDSFYHFSGINSVPGY